MFLSLVDAMVFVVLERSSILTLKNEYRNDISTTANESQPTPLCYEREISDLVFFFKALFGITDLDVNTFVSFSNNNRTRLCQNPSLTLKVPLCKSNTFKASYFNRLVKIWNYTYKILPPTTFATLSSFKRNIRSTYKHLLGTMFDIEMPCTWSLLISGI